MQNERNKKIAWRKATLVFLGLILFVPVLAACSLFGGEKAPDNEPSTLRIGVMYSYGGDFDSYRVQFTDMFEFANPHIDLEFVAAVDYGDYYSTYPSQEEQPDPVEEMKKLMEGPNPPDLVMVGYSDLEQLIADNLLQPLDPLLQESKINVDEEFVPAVVEGIREMGNNQLYALAPTFSSSALLFNRDLFAQAGVEEPTDFMTWDEIFDLASRVANGEGEDRVYGFGFERYMYSDPFYSMRTYTAPLGLKMYDEDAGVMTVDRPEWREVWQDFIDLYEQEIMFNEMANEGIYRPGNSPFSHDLFMSGKLAMTLVYYSELDQIINANNNASNIEGFEFIDWDVVTFPVHDEAPEVGGRMNIEPVMAINAQAQNKEAAWDLIEFVHGEKWAEIKSRSSYNMVSRIDYIEPKQGVDFNVAAFYQLKPAKEADYYYTGNDYRYWEVESIGMMKFREVMSGNLSVEDALAQWEAEGNEILSQPIPDDDFGGGIPLPEPMPFDVEVDAESFDDIDIAE